ncbi:SfiI family type II restriction endonuclease [Candidatus Viridilinea mediisalina]|uniref:Type II restriction endonuclease n=1 Tax=Candidatus Viridilinea mediisalina TaxID=2024553 RepID=A0A2A6RLX0_9CHLR|nr:SfiI family type II restriction endonuclease [Candidatus Viridilinea mediisalina]PDW03868.1 type II restriction endonuclease [Candidatus Viridilinea mediisalina]
MTTIDPHALLDDLNRIEEIEKASLRMVVQALYDYRQDAALIFDAESDQVADVGEDITREALDRLGNSRVHQRLFGKVDYKRACYLFHPDFAVKQALFIDSKAEKVSGAGTATLQISQLSMIVKQIRAGEAISIPGKLPQILTLNHDHFLTTTIFVKYAYEESEKRDLRYIIVAALPNGLLQARYNPHEHDTIWLAGRNAPSLGEEFRVRLHFERLKQKATWRVQRIPMQPQAYAWHE